MGSEVRETMSNDFELSRRKALAALGTIGVASAGAGLGTSAYFSDQETFENNRLVAGSLDLKVDWEEHYSDWSADEGDGVEFSMEEPDNPDQYRRFPAGASDATIGDHPLWVHVDDVPTFMDNTAIDALPDTDNNGTAEFPTDEMADNGQTSCELLNTVDVGDDDDGLSSDLRTSNDVTNPGDPLINLQDVKPGDFGEVTFSIHLCDNPGYVWMNMPGGLTESENGVTEPEADDPDEDDQPGDEDTSGELADTIQTALWYDLDCDNLPDLDGRPVDLLAIADIAGSIDESEMDTIENAANEFVDELPQDGSVEAGFMTFNGPSEGFSPEPDDQFGGIHLQAPIGNPTQFFDNGTPNVGQFLPDAGAGSTPMPAAIDIGRQYINAAARPEAQKIILLVTDGGPDYVSPDSPQTPPPYETSTPQGTFSADPQDGNNDGISSFEEQAETAGEADQCDADDVLLFTVAVGTADPEFEGPQTLPSYLETEIATSPSEAFDATGAADLDAIAQDIGLRISTIAGGENGNGAEPILFTGTLSELESYLTADNGLGAPLDSDVTTEARECFNPGMVHCFGLSWWLPLDHGNQVQSDSASFDIGFYTEQCRHNDGSGMNNEGVDPEELDA
jgi:predicted ribosomally synthesized peptide with SipW-like signal peptide